MQFLFSNTKTVSRNTSSYPITLDDVKDKSFYFKDNPDDDTLDSYIEDFVIPKIISDWEDSTKYILLDTETKSFVPNIEFINSNRLPLSLNHLNVRSIESLKYYEYDVSLPATKTEITSSYFSTSEEIKVTPKKIYLHYSLLPLRIYPVENNLECSYLAGFENNVFTTLSQEIKDCLAAQASLVVDVKQGYCDNFYIDFITKVYDDYSLAKRLIEII